MSIRPVSRMTAIVAISFAFALLTVLPANATDAIVRYEGTGVETDTTIAGLPSSTEDVVVTLDCSANPCVLKVTATANGLSAQLAGPQPLAVTSLSGNFDVAETGPDPCVATWVGEGALAYSIQKENLTMTRMAPGFPPRSCPDGNTRRGDSYQVEITAHRVSGDACLLSGTCGNPNPSAESGEKSDVSVPQFSTPSTLSTLPTIASAVAPSNIAWAAAASLVLVLLVALPTQLLNSAAERGSERMSAWWRTIRPKWSKKSKKRPDPRGSTRPLAGWPLAAAGVAVASLISSFVSPTFGFNMGSVRVFLSIVVSFFVDAVASWFIVIWLVRRAYPTAKASFTFAPASLLIVVGAVLFSRLSGFQPGFVYGVVAGVAFGSALALADKARTSLIALGFSFVLAVFAWVGYSVIVETAGAHSGGGLLFVRETLSSLAIAGIAALPIALAPLRGLTGFEIFTWSRRVWAAAYAIGLFGFFVVLMPKPFSWATVPLSVWVWGSIFVAYAIVAVGAWLLIVRPWQPTEESDLNGAPERAE
jgi:hypothetical protein